MVKELKALYANVVQLSPRRAQPHTDSTENESKLCIEEQQRVWLVYSVFFTFRFFSLPFSLLSFLSSSFFFSLRVSCYVFSPYIVALHDAFHNPHDGSISIVMEYMDGKLFFFLFSLFSLLFSLSPSFFFFLLSIDDIEFIEDIEKHSLSFFFLSGGSLQDIINSGGCDSENVISNIAYRVLRGFLNLFLLLFSFLFLLFYLLFYQPPPSKGLAFLHSRHQLHRDIKPSNLLISHTGEVKVSDFGIVKELESTADKANTFVGTLTYMSPERIK